MCSRGHGRAYTVRYDIGFRSFIRLRTIGHVTISITMSVRIKFKFRIDTPGARRGVCHSLIRICTEYALLNAVYIRL